MKDIERILKEINYNESVIKHKEKKKVDNYKKYINKYLYNKFYIKYVDEYVYIYQIKYNKDILIKTTKDNYKSNNEEFRKRVNKSYIKNYISTKYKISDPTIATIIINNHTYYDFVHTFSVKDIIKHIYNTYIIVYIKTIMLKTYLLCTRSNRY